MYSLKLHFTELPRSLNKGLRTHYFKRQKENQFWDILVASKCARCLPVKPLERAKITIVRHFWRQLDYDGCVGSLKPVIDALVTCGVLKDDSWNVTGPWVVDQKFRPKKDGPLLEVFIEQA
jgi:hypothetical protein